MWLTLVACSVPDVPPDNSNHGSVEAEPTSIFFGSVEWGHTATATLTFRNDSHEDAWVKALVPSSDEFVVDDLGPFTVPRKGFVERTVEWTPSSLDGVHEYVDVVGRGGRYTWVPIEGNSVYGVLSTSIDHYDFDPVGVGCEPFVDVVLHNGGTVDLVVSFESTHPSEILVRDTEDLPLETPLVIGPSTDEVVRVVYAPSTVGEIDATLELRSNDPEQPTLPIALRGEGLPTEARTLEWTIDGVAAVTGIVQVNQAVSEAPFSDRFHDFLPAFFDALLETGLPFRIAFVTDGDGYVAGPVSYVDDSFTRYEAVEAVWGMLGGLSWGDNDEGLETCLNALDVNEAWLLDDADPWALSKLNFVVINNDAEQSPRNAESYINALGDYQDLARVAVHAIAGDVPSGCASEGGTALPSPVLQEATERTGGLYLSICDTDWTKNVSSLVAAFHSYTTGFVSLDFPEYPAPESIDVYVDDVEMLTGWHYDLVSNALVFDDPLPIWTTLRVDYVGVESCW